jgi:uncharacterized protein YdeI (YjbR/CyaY-like superfamily)
VARVAAGESRHGDRAARRVSQGAIGIPSVTWPEAVDQALCFGWFDGRINRLNETSYTHRFTPRRTNSTWSAVNVARVAELTEQGLMHEARLHAFAARRADRTAVYSHERDGEPVLPPDFAARLEADAAAWACFPARRPS